jgi:hypothetical protein
MPKAVQSRSWRSDSLNPLAAACCRFAARSRDTQVAGVVSLIPRSRATSAADFPVSFTILTAPARKSGSYRRLASAI